MNMIDIVDWKDRAIDMQTMTLSYGRVRVISSVEMMNREISGSNRA